MRYRAAPRPDNEQEYSMTIFFRQNRRILHPPSEISKALPSFIALPAVNDLGCHSLFIKDAVYLCSGDIDHLPIVRGHIFFEFVLIAHPHNPPSQLDSLKAKHRPTEERIYRAKLAHVRVFFGTRLTPQPLFGQSSTWLDSV